MRGDELPSGDHVLRHVGDRLLTKDEDGNPRGYIEPAALATLPGDFLSVQWVEFDPNATGDPTIGAIQSLRRVRNTPKSSAFAKARVGIVAGLCGIHRPSAPVRILHEPDEDNPAHAGIHHLPRDDADLLRLLAEEAFTELIWSKDIPPG